MNFRVVWTSHTEGNRTVVDDFKLDGELMMSLDVDQLFGPLGDVVNLLSDPDVIAAYEALPSDDGES